VCWYLICFGLFTDFWNVIIKFNLYIYVLINIHGIYNISVLMVNIEFMWLIVCQYPLIMNNKNLPDRYGRVPKVFTGRQEQQAQQVQNFNYKVS
jgi:hypothetical protein